MKKIKLASLCLSFVITLAPLLKADGLDVQDGSIDGATMEPVGLIPAQASVSRWIRLPKASRAMSGASKPSAA